MIQCELKLFLVNGIIDRSLKVHEGGSEVAKGYFHSVRLISEGELIPQIHLHVLTPVAWMAEQPLLNGYEYDDQLVIVINIIIIAIVMSSSSSSS